MKWELCIPVSLFLSSSSLFLFFSCLPPAVKRVRVKAWDGRR